MNELNNLSDRIRRLGNGYIRHLCEDFSRDLAGEFWSRAEAAWEARRPNRESEPYAYFAWDEGLAFEDGLDAFLGILGDFMEEVDRDYTRHHRLSYDPNWGRFCVEFVPNQDTPA